MVNGTANGSVAANAAKGAAHAAATAHPLVYDFWTVVLMLLVAVLLCAPFLMVAGNVVGNKVRKNRLLGLTGLAGVDWSRHHVEIQENRVPQNRIPWMASDGKSELGFVIPGAGSAFSSNRTGRWFFVDRARLGTFIVRRQVAEEDRKEFWRNAKERLAAKLGADGKPLAVARKQDGEPVFDDRVFDALTTLDVSPARHALEMAPEDGYAVHMYASGAVERAIASMLGEGAWAMLVKFIPYMLIVVCILLVAIFAMLAWVSHVF